LPENIFKESHVPKLIRRSLLPVNMSDMSIPEQVLRARSDVLILDLETVLQQRRSALSQSEMLAIIGTAGGSAAEVFIRVQHDTVDMDLEIAVWPGLTGIFLPGVESVEEIQEASKHLAELEHRRGIPEGSLKIDAEIGTAVGVCNSLDIARSSPRLVALSVGETSLYKDLQMDVEARLDEDPLRFIKGQIIVNARAAGIQAQGMSYPLSITLEEAGEPALKQAVRRARDSGFKGALCPHISWVKACNEGFRPSDEEMAYYRKAREAFADGLRRGLASVPLDGKMIDVPVDRRARAFLEWGDQCAKRDAEKARAS
jgi:citrate lyase subunit beta/citryl-CoA lyase